MGRKKEKQMASIIKDVMTRMLGEDGAVLIFKCADCGKIDAIIGYENIHLAAGSQAAGEAEKFFCDDCPE